MIGHFLLSLTPAEEERVLTRVMRPGSYIKVQDSGPCLVGTVCAASMHGGQDRALFKLVRARGWLTRPRVEARYDGLCKKFGVNRVNAAIRNRILTNQLRRELAQAFQHEAAAR